MYNLLVRLRKLRRRRVWIDALCVDQSVTQSALREKAQQIRLMGKIYSSANKVVVDLGEVDQKSNVALRLIRKFCAMWHNEDASLRQLGLPDQGSLEWVHLKHFLIRPWFRHIWIVQEYVLDVTIELIVGLDAFHGEPFLNGIFAFENEKSLVTGLEEAASTLIDAASLSVHCILSMSTLRKALRDGKSTSVGNLQPMCRCYLSTHLRDKIYRLLGLANDGACSRRLPYT